MSCGPELVADKLGHEFFGTVQFVLEFAVANVSDVPSYQGFGRMGVLGEGFSWDVLALGRVLCEASIIQTSLEAQQGCLSGVVGAANRSVVEEESWQVHGAAGGLSLRCFLWDGSLEAEGKEQWASGVALLNPLFLGSFLRGT